MRERHPKRSTLKSQFSVSDRHESASSQMSAIIELATRPTLQEQNVPVAVRMKENKRTGLWFGKVAAIGEAYANSDERGKRSISRKVKSALFHDKTDSLVHNAVSTPITLDIVQEGCKTLLEILKHPSLKEIEIHLLVKRLQYRMTIAKQISNYGGSRLEFHISYGNSASLEGGDFTKGSAKARHFQVIESLSYRNKDNLVNALRIIKLAVKEVNEVEGGGTKLTLDNIMKKVHRDKLIELFFEGNLLQTSAEPTDVIFWHWLYLVGRGVQENGVSSDPTQRIQGLIKYARRAASANVDNEWIDLKAHRVPVHEIPSNPRPVNFDSMYYASKLLDVVEIAPGIAIELDSESRKGVLQIRIDVSHATLESAGSLREVAQIFASSVVSESPLTDNQAEEQIDNGVNNKRPNGPRELGRKMNEHKVPIMSDSIGIQNSVTNLKNYYYTGLSSLTFDNVNFVRARSDVYRFDGGFYSSVSSIIGSGSRESRINFIFNQPNIVNAVVTEKELRIQCGDTWYMALGYEKVNDIYRVEKDELVNTKYAPNTEGILIELGNKF